MDLKLVKSQIFHESVARRVFFRIFLFASAISIIPIVHILTTYDFKSFHLPKSQGCYGRQSGGKADLPRGSYLFQGHFLNPVWDSFDAMQCQENVNLTITVIKELVDRKHLFNHSAKALYVGGSSSSAVSALRDLGFSSAVGVDQGRLFSLKRKQFGYKLDYANASFDFVLFRGKFKLSIPDLVVVEIERVVNSGGIGAVVFGISSPTTANISIRSAARVASLLKTSCVVHSGYVNNFYMTVFKKKPKNDVNSDQFHHLPTNCSTFAGNRTLLQQMEHV